MTSCTQHMHTYCDINEIMHYFLSENGLDHVLFSFIQVANTKQVYMKENTKREEIQ